MLYCAIIGDIVNSKKLKEHRRDSQEKFISVINYINSKYERFIESNFTVTLGDEFQGLLNNASISYEIIQDIKEQMYPMEVVFGVGVGTMETPFAKEISIGSDGPAYHYARKMCERAKKKKPSICYYSNSIVDELINSQIYLIQTITKKRTPVQKRVVELYKKGYSQEDISKILEKNQSTVSRNLRAAHYIEVLQAEKEIVEVLDKVGGKKNS